MLRFVKQHIIGFIALCVALGGTAYAANTVRSIDIVDGQVKTQDIAKHAVTPDKLTPDIFHTDRVVRRRTDQCGQMNVWVACSVFTFQVPAGHRYMVTATASITGDGGPNGSAALFCPASDGPTCFYNDPGPEWVTFPAKTVASGTISGEKEFSYTGKDVHLNVAVKLLGPVYTDPYAHVTLM